MFLAALRMYSLRITESMKNRDKTRKKFGPRFDQRGVSEHQFFGQSLYLKNLEMKIIV